MGDPLNKALANKAIDVRPAIEELTCKRHTSSRRKTGAENDRNAADILLILDLRLPTVSHSLALPVSQFSMENLQWPCGAGNRASAATAPARLVQAAPARVAGGVLQPPRSRPGPR